MKRLCLGLVLLGVSGSAFAQLGTYSESPACCQLTTAMIQDVVYGKDQPADEGLLNDSTPANFHLLIDTSASMQELPQVLASKHSEFFAMTVNGCQNPRLDAFSASRGWDPTRVYPVPDPGTGLGSDVGFPNLFLDNKYYGYLYWGTSNNPAPNWNTNSEACTSQVPGGTGNAAEFNRCMTCLSTKGYYLVPGTIGRDTAPLTNTKFIFWGRYLNFNPPKYVSIRAAIKQFLKDVRGKRVGMSHFSNTTPNTVLDSRQNPSCSQIINDASSFDNYRASYINMINTLTFSTNTPLARSLLNIGYLFTSDDSVYRNMFGFGSGYSYPSAFRNGSLASQGRSVCWGCQGSSVIIISDGEPSTDSLSSTVVSRLRAINGGPVYCPDNQPCGSGDELGRDMGANPADPADDNPDYYLDDVAKLLSEQDLEQNSPPIVGDFNTSGRQSLRTDTIGFGYDSNLLRNTARVGGGLYYSVSDAAGLKQVLTTLLEIPSTPMRPMGLSSASVESQPGRAPASTLIPRFKPSTEATSPWQGFLYRFQLTPEKAVGCNPQSPQTGGDLNQDGDCDDTLLVDAAGDAVAEDASGAFVKALNPLIPAQPFWEAGQVLKPTGPMTAKWQTRRILTIVDMNRDGRIDRLDAPIEFTEANSFFLRDYLGISSNPNGCADLAAQLGVASLTPDECAKVVIRWYRGADALNPDPALRGYDRPFLLQDIFHSVPVGVEPPQPKDACAFSAQCLPSLFRGATQLQSDYSLPTSPGWVDAYDKYAFEAGDRDKIVLVGSNGGMLHAFLNGRRVGADPSTGRNLFDNGTGQELWAFIPPGLLPKLRPNLGKHAYFVDGTPMVREVWLDGTGGQPSDGRKQWQEYRTVAVVGSGRGSVHRFALDLTRLLGQAPGDTGTLTPNQPGDFLWMWPQPCDPLALKVGESFSNFAPQPPPIGPVALTPSADDFLRTRSGTGTSGVDTPWLINSTPARERWVVALNGGYDPYQTRGRGMALVDVQSGHTVWSFFHQDPKSRAQYLQYSFAAGMALADVGSPSSQGADADQLFDTATVGDYGGQLWAVRFWQPGQWDSSTQQVNNWFAARSFRVANMAGRTGSTEALRAPFSTIATNVVQPDSGILRTFVGTGDSPNILDTGTKCRLGNPRACAEQGCSSQSYLEVRRAGAPVSISSTNYASYALTSASSQQYLAGPSCAGTSVKLTWNNDAFNGCANANDGALEYVCDGDPTTWSCRTVQDTWVKLNYTQTAPLYPHRFYGFASYGGDPTRTFNTEAEAGAFDSRMLTDTDLVNVGQFDPNGNVVASQEVSAHPLSKGWYLPYATASERTGSAATVIDGCILWSSFEPAPMAFTTCSPSGSQNTSRLYQANFLYGTASCAQGFYSPFNGTWARFLPFGTQTNLGSPAPQLFEYNDDLHRQATLGTPSGTLNYSPGPPGNSPFMSLPVSEGPP